MKITIFNGKIHYFDWAIFKSYVTNYQRVTNLIHVNLSENLGESPNSVAESSRDLGYPHKMGRQQQRPRSTAHMAAASQVSG